MRNWKPYKGQECVMLCDLSILNLKKNDLITIGNLRQCKCGR